MPNLIVSCYKTLISANYYISQIEIYFPDPAKAASSKS